MSQNTAVASIDFFNQPTGADIIALTSYRKGSLQDEESIDHHEFVARLVHELRTPLACISGVVSLLEDGLLGELNGNGNKVVAQTKQVCKRMSRLIDDMLDIEKIRAGKFSLACKSISLEGLLNTVVESLRPIAGKREIIVEANDLQFWADEERISQVLFNLLSNAIKNTNDGSTIKLRAQKVGGNMVKIKVIDKGCGIPADKINKIFDAFEQVQCAATKSKGGTGLGLAIAKSIITEHGGKIGANSRLGKGSTFWFTLPAEKHQ